MTTGQIIRKNLGLENFKYVRLGRVLGAGPIKVILIFFNSYNPNYPISTARIKRSRRVASVFNGGDIANDVRQLRYLPLTPLVDLDVYAGAVGANTLVIPVDLSGDRYIDNKEFTSSIKEKIDDLTKDLKIIKFYENEKGEVESKIEEGITIKDLMKNQGLSDFTKGYKKIKNTIMKAENKKYKFN